MNLFYRHSNLCRACATIKKTWSVGGENLSVWRMRNDEDSLPAADASLCKVVIN